MTQLTMPDQAPTPVSPTIQLTVKIEWMESQSGNPRKEYDHVFSLQFFNNERGMYQRSIRGVSDDDKDTTLQEILAGYVVPDDTGLISGDRIADLQNTYDDASTMKKLAYLTEHDTAWLKKHFAFWGGVYHDAHTTGMSPYCVDDYDNGVLFLTHANAFITYPMLYHPVDDSIPEENRPLPVPLSGLVATGRCHDGVFSLREFSQWMTVWGTSEFDEYVAWANGEMVMPKVTIEMPTNDLLPDEMQERCACCNNRKFDPSSLLVGSEAEMPWYGYDQYDSNSANDGDAVVDNIMQHDTLCDLVNVAVVTDEIKRHHRHGLCVDIQSILVDIPLTRFPAWCWHVAQQSSTPPPRTEDKTG